MSCTAVKAGIATKRPELFLYQRVLAYCVPNNTLNCDRLATDKMLFSWIVGTPSTSTTVINHTEHMVVSAVSNTKVRFSMLLMPSIPVLFAEKKSATDTALI